MYLCLIPSAYIRGLLKPREKGHRTQRRSGKVRYERIGVGERSNQTWVPEQLLELGDQLSYFHQVSLVFNYPYGNASSKFLDKVEVNEHRKLGRDYMSLSCCSYSFLWTRMFFQPSSLSPAALHPTSKPFQIHTTAYPFL